MEATDIAVFYICSWIQGMYLTKFEYKRPRMQGKYWNMDNTKGGNTKKTEEISRWKAHLKLLCVYVYLSSRDFFIFLVKVWILRGCKRGCAFEEYVLIEYAQWMLWSQIISLS